jgi:hypothetical protein
MTDTTADPDTAAEQNTAAEQDTSKNADVLKRDYIIMMVGITILCGGLVDGLMRGLDLSFWLALPAGLAVWGVFFRMAYTKYQDLE